MRALWPGEQTALVIVACLVIAAVIAVVFPYVTSPPTRPSPEPIGPQASPFISPGKIRPATVPAAAAGLPDDQPVIGVMAKKTARAYVRKAFAGVPNHVVNDVVGDTPVTVTHFNGCTRVYTGPGSEPLPFMTGGFADGLLLCVDAASTNRRPASRSVAPTRGPFRTSRSDSRRRPGGSGAPPTRTRMSISGPHRCG